MNSPRRKLAAYELIAPGRVRHCCSPGALDISTLANVVCNSSVADGGDNVGQAVTNQWVNSQLGHVMSAETYRRLHTPAKLSNPVMQSVANLLNLFRVITAKAFKATVELNLNHDKQNMR